jgi:AcrR family transcriptional regulator
MEMNAQDSLRERKKARTRASLREHALRLFREQGYQATTIEQIAAAAEVSPSTFFRYFPTKEDLILQDDMDVRMLEAFSRQPVGLAPVAAIRAATKEALTSFGYEDMAQIRETIRLTLTVPEIRIRAMDEFARTIEVIAEAIGKRVGRPPGDMAVRTLAGAVVGVIMSVTIPWQERMLEQSPEEMFTRIDEALALLEEGLPLLAVTSREDGYLHRATAPPRHRASRPHRAGFILINSPRSNQR